ncbi:MAG: hypothetical protein ACXV5Q_09550 [Frankiaceae bacterium]
MQFAPVGIRHLLDATVTTAPTCRDLEDVHEHSVDVVDLDADHGRPSVALARNELTASTASYKARAPLSEVEVVVLLGPPLLAVPMVWRDQLRAVALRRLAELEAG